MCQLFIAGELKANELNKDGEKRIYVDIQIEKILVGPKTGSGDE